MEVVQSVIKLEDVNVEESSKARYRTSSTKIDTAGMYNPAKSGVAYYFTANGAPLWKLPTYAKDCKPESTRCKKTFGPTVRQKGSTFLMLCFCPLHGHCHGFHMVPESEGRKDPHAAMLCYLPKPPLEVYYDFACGLSEYCWNREPFFYAGTRFFHDTFHRFSHKCSFSLSTAGITSLKCNTSICEQFNSHLRRIARCLPNLTQEHFVFFVQFFTHRWNLRKANELEVLKKIADGYSSQI
jgi:hypothetical protein